MAAIGHEVLGVDIDEGKVSLLNSGKAWFHEPDLDEMLAENVQAGRLRFTTSLAEAAEFGSVHFVGVATPGQPDGSYDLSQLHAAVSSLIPLLSGNALIIGKCTVPPGTAAALQTAISSGQYGAAACTPGIVWNPEFLREGSAVQDTLRPDRLVVGATTAHAATIMEEIYRPLTEAGVPLLITDLATAELVKGAANAFLATKISFINAMGDICAATGGDVSVLASALGMDPRIGPDFLRVGIGYGGACLPKDVRGLGTFAGGIGARKAMELLAAVDAVNASRSRQVVDLVREALGTLTAKCVTVWGAAFKPGTDDVRDSPGLRVAGQLYTEGSQVTVYDPMAGGNAFAAFPEFAYADSAQAAARDADVLVITTAWPEFAQVPPAELVETVSRTAVVDACQAIDAAAWSQAGWDVFSLTSKKTGQVRTDLSAPAA
jgi:UDPglucose 6-dehydrogenase